MKRHLLLSVFVAFITAGSALACINDRDTGGYEASQHNSYVASRGTYVPPPPQDDVTWQTIAGVVGGMALISSLVVVLARKGIGGPTPLA